METQEIEIILKCGYSLGALKRMYEEKSGINASIEFTADEVCDIDDADLEKKKSIVETLIKCAKEIGHPQNHVFSAIGQTVYNSHIRVYAAQSLVLYRDAIKQTSEKMRELCGLLKAEYPTVLKEIKRLFVFCGIMADGKDLPKEWIFSPELENFLPELKMLIDLNFENSEICKTLLTSFEEEVLELDGIGLNLAWIEAESKNSISKKMKQNGILRKLSSVSKISLDNKDAVKALSQLSDYKENLIKIQELREKNEKLLRGYVLQNNKTNWIYLKKLESQTESFSRKLSEIDAHSLRVLVKEEDMRLLQSFYGTWRTFSEVQSGVYKIFQIDESRLTFVGDYLSSQTHMCESWHENIAELKSWIQWNAAKKAAAENGLSKVIGAYESGMSHELILDAYEKGMLGALIEYYEWEAHPDET